MTTIGVTYNDAYPVAIEVVKDVIGDLASVTGVYVPAWRLSAAEEDAFIGALSTMTCVLQRPGNFSERVISALPNLRHIAVHGAGFDKIDLGAANRLRVQVTNAPGANAISVAELVVCLMVMMLRNLLVATSGVARGQWGEVRKTGAELLGKRLGILGVGHVGSQVATRARGLGMHVIAYDPAYSKENFRARGITWLPSDEVIATADILTLHVPLDTSTRNLINVRSLALMRPGTYLLNLSRGPVVDEDALFEALTSGHIGAAALDVRKGEPPGEPDKLRRLPNVILTPHIGGSTTEALERIARMCADEIARFLSGRPLQWPVNNVVRCQ